MRIDDAIEQLNPNKIDITKVLSLSSWLEIEDQYSFLHLERAQPSQCVPQNWESKSLSEFLTILASTNEPQIQETLLQAKAFLKPTISNTTLMRMIDEFRSGSHDDHLSSLDDSRTYESQEFDNYERPSCLFSQ